MNVLKKPKFYFYIALALFGVITRDSESTYKWAPLTIAIYSLPLVFFFIRRARLEYITAWFSVFCLLQTVVSALYINDFATLAPYTRNYFKFKDESKMGIHGPQLVTTDIKGFRSLHPVDYLHKNKFRVLAIGGSTTEQIYLDDKNTWTSLLEEELKQYLHRDVEVINTGLSGLTLIDHYYTLIRTEYLKPDLVVFLFGVNDWNRQILRAFDPSIAEMTASQWCFRKTMLGRFIRTMLLEPSYILKKFKKQKTTSLASALSIADPPINKETKRWVDYKVGDVSLEFKKAYALVSERCEKAEYKCVFLNQPHAYGFTKSPKFPKSIWMNPPFVDYSVNFNDMNEIANFYNQYIIQNALAHHVASCDLASQVTSDDLDMFYDDCHYNTKGAQWMSEKILSCLKEQKLLN